MFLKDQELISALNEQINKEFYSAYLYLSMAAYADSMGLSGFASWLEKQAKEELEHGMKIYKYLQDRNARVALDAVEKPKAEWSSIVEVFEDALEHEFKVTESINKLMDLAVQKKEYATISFLQWFIDEQVEEEKSFKEILDILKSADNLQRVVSQLDRELAKRGKGG